HESQTIKEFLSIIEVPTTHEERLIFVEKMLVLQDKLPSMSIEETKDAIEEFEAVLEIEFLDPEVVCYYRLFLLPAFLKVGEVEKARGEIYYIEKSLNKDNLQHMYHYNLNLRAMASLECDYESAIKHAEKAMEIAACNDGFLQIDINRAKYNAALDYTSLHYPMEAIMLLRDINYSIKGYRVDSSGLQRGVDMLLGVNYARVGKHEEAEALLEAAIKRAKVYKDKQYLGSVLYNFGTIKKLSKNWKQAREYFKEARELLPSLSMLHFLCIYGDIQCIIMTKSFSEAEDMLKEAKIKSKDYPDQEMVEVLLGFLECIRIIIKGGTIFRREEAAFVQEKAIPFFLHHHMKFEAMWAYEILSVHYSKARKDKQSAEMYISSLEVHKALFKSE
ncbi:MAG: tetratricopeptide repeat protein, partial [Defluviitaleaceae bacterium]|nr:tetratricopeptide repeat protein [Defluviitaleaceae bacterium]